MGPIMGVMLTYGTLLEIFRLEIFRLEGFAVRLKPGVGFFGRDAYVSLARSVSRGCGQ